MIKNVIFLLFVFFTCNINSQKYEFGKVSVYDLQEKVNHKDSNAVAAILYKKGYSHFRYEDKKGFSVIHEIEFRIKIYKTEGLKWADFSVPFYVGYENLSDESVSFSNAVTYNLENGSIVKTKLNNEGSFKKNVNEYWNEASIAMPNVKVGSIIEFKYTLKSENIVTFPKFNFQYDIPVNFCEYKTEIPEFFIYKPISVGFFKVQSETKLGNGYQNFTNENKQTVNIDYQQINSIYTASNIPALLDEDFVDNIDNYKSALHHELEKTRFPEVPEKLYTKTWDDVAKDIYKNKEFGDELKDKSFFDTDLRLIIKNDTTQIQKANTILKFLQNKMNWDLKNGYLTNKKLQKAYEEKTGNVAEINLLLLSMLNYAGITAYPVLLSTVDHGIPVFPNRAVFNYVIVLAEIDNKRIMMDATDKNTTLNILPLRDLNWTGRLIKNDGVTEEINLVPDYLSKDNTNIIVSIDNNDFLSGKIRTQKTDYEAYNFRKNLKEKNNQTYIENLENEYNDISITNYSIENEATDLTKPIIERYDFESKNHIEKTGNKYFINPLLFFEISKNPFTQEKRELPIYYGYPTQKRIIISVEIPQEYTIESFPKSITIKTPNDIMSFTYKSNSLENKIQISVTTEINSAIIHQDYYDIIKDFYKQMIDKQNEKIVLVKK
jgi:Domain of Unknown Function with PDB structure (DUF3857)